MKKLLSLFLAVAAVASAQTSILWRQITDRPAVYTKTEADELRAALLPRQGLFFDGSAGANLSIPAFRTNDFTVVVRYKPAALVSNRRIIQGVPAQGFNFADLGNGTVGAGKSDVGVAVTSSASLLAAGATRQIAYTRAGTVGTFYNAGTAWGTGSDSYDYAQGLTKLGSYTDNSLGIKGTISSLYVYNFALSASELLQLDQSGPYPLHYNGATYTNLLSSTLTRNSDFSAGATDWTSTNGGTVSVVSSKLHIVTTAGGQVASLASPYFGGDFQTGRRYRITFTVTNFAPGVTLRVSAGGTNQVIADYPSPADGTYTTDFVPTGPGTQLFFISPSAGRTWDLDDISIVPLGLICALEPTAPGNGYVWADQSGNGAHAILPTSGAVWTQPSDASNKVRGTTATNGNQQLLGSTTLEANTQIARIRARSLSGTPTITLGTTAGGSEIASSVALSTTWKDIPIALTGGIVSTASSVWVGSSSTTTVEVLLSVQKL